MSCIQSSILLREIQESVTSIQTKRTVWSIRTIEIFCKDKEGCITRYFTGKLFLLGKRAIEFELSNRFSRLIQFFLVWSMCLKPRRKILYISKPCPIQIASPNFREVQSIIPLMAQWFSWEESSEYFNYLTFSHQEYTTQWDVCFLWTVSRFCRCF